MTSSEELAVTDQPPNAFVATTSNLVLSTAFSVLLTGFGALMASAVLGRGELIGLGFVVIAVLGAYGSVRWVNRLLNRQPAISIDDDGIVDRTSLGPPVRIRWTDIDSVSADESTLRLRLVPEAEVKMPLARRLMGWLFHRKEFVIPTRFLDTPPAAVEAVICGRHELLQLSEFKRTQAALSSGADQQHAADAPDVIAVEK
jgi:hypothetical protein